MPRESELVQRERQLTQHVPSNTQYWASSDQTLVQEIREAFECVLKLGENSCCHWQSYGISIDAYEVRLAMRALGFVIKREEVREIIALADASGTGQLSYSQFEALMLPRMRNRAQDRSVNHTNKRLSEAFRHFKPLSSGAIGLTALRAACAECGLKLEDAEMRVRA